MEDIKEEIHLMTKDQEEMEDIHLSIRKSLTYHLLVKKTLTLIQTEKCQSFLKLTNVATINILVLLLDKLPTENRYTTVFVQDSNSTQIPVMQLDVVIIY